MRVKRRHEVTAATGGDGPTNATTTKSALTAFLCDVSVWPRPMREPGLDIHTWLAMKMPASSPVDGKPRWSVSILMLRREATVRGTAGATVRNVVGVLDYGFRRYTILLDPTANMIVEGNKSYVAASPAAERELTVGAFNIENFFDDEKNSDNVEKEAVLPKDFFQKRLNKASLAIRKVLSMPDVLGIVEVENLKVLKSSRRNKCGCRGRGFARS